jgi:hypothetical protein
MLMREAAKHYGWHLNYPQIALMWRGGCIIRSAFLGNIKTAFTTNPDLQVRTAVTDPFAPCVCVCVCVCVLPGRVGGGGGGRRAPPPHTHTHTHTHTLSLSHAPPFSFVVVAEPAARRFLRRGRSVVPGGVAQGHRRCSRARHPRASLQHSPLLLRRVPLRSASGQPHPGSA